MDLTSIDAVERATRPGKRELFRLGTALLFIVGIMLCTGLQAEDVPGSVMLVVAAMIGGYMALNIGAKDVANNVGPAVGSKALTRSGAILIAAIFESSGALIAGGDVVTTIKGGIVDPVAIGDSDVFIWMMTGALLAGAIWLNMATAIGAPVSTTHSIVGGVVGAGIATGGWSIANWSQVGAIAASWIISPLLGGVIAAGFMYLIKRTISYQADRVAAARHMVPALIALMAWAFVTYLTLKGVKHVWKTSFPMAAFLGLVASLALHALVRPMIARARIDAEDANCGVQPGWLPCRCRPCSRPCSTSPSAA